MAMRDTHPIETSMIRRSVLTLATLAVAISMTACSHAMMMIHGTGAKRPAASEFGLGPRSSAQGRYVATLEPAKALRPRQMQTVRVNVRDAEGRAIDEAQISIDGGMPQHGHGLPTRPRVTSNLGEGMYEIEGVRFNMGGWWEFKLVIAGARGADTVTFNLAL
jgi:hypothetical protein